MRPGPLHESQLREYQSDGYLFRRGLFDDEEIGLLRGSAKADRALDAHAMGRRDGEGGTVRLSLWNHPGEGIYGMVARCRRVVDTVEQLRLRRLRASPSGWPVSTACHQNSDVAAGAGLISGGASFAVRSDVSFCFCCSSRQGFSCL